VSANLLVDLNNTCQMSPSIVAPPALSGFLAAPQSGVQVGLTVDLLNANTFCNVYACGGVSESGLSRLQVQTSDATTSGSFTDPTSGLPVMPTSFSSGGVLWLNSGGGALSSGFFFAAAFQRPHRYARLVQMSGDWMTGALAAGFISALKTTGSGGGFTYSPGSGSVRV
jgi:hypothetical protein